MFEHVSGRSHIGGRSDGCLSLQKMSQQSAPTEQSNLARSGGCKHKQIRFVQFSLSVQSRGRKCGCIFEQSHFLHLARKGHSAARVFGCKDLQLLILQRSPS